ncbi:MAG: DUF1800 domain-containing protein [Cyanobacteria bacterium P01_F01_bin.33]
MNRRHLLSLGTTTVLGGIALRNLSQARPAIAASSNVPRERRVLNRLSFGATPQDLARVRQMGINAYIEEQLHPNVENDPDCQARLRAATLAIGSDDHSRPKQRPLQTLDWSLPQLWQLTEDEDDFEALIRPAAEVMAATWIRAVYSQWQLQELLVDFWHNHFNINIFKDEWIAVTWPYTDRLMRQHALGNFRVFLEAIAQSPAMLLYLDNASSKASPANENFARELFELHTLGSEHYLNDRYQNWRDVPGAIEQNAIGYIDQDVYEAARAFTGWTIAAELEDEEGGEDLNTGEFHIQNSWHDPYQKRVLGVEFAPNQSPLADGCKVLDLVAYHPGTAEHLCTKLCRRLVADDPPPSLVRAAVKTWLEHRDRPHQIRETVRVIVQSPEFLDGERQKVKRPFEFLASYLRASQASFNPSFAFLESTENSGQMLFGWPTPEGYPDRAAYWLSTHGTLARWHSLFDLTLDEQADAIQFDLQAQMPTEVRTHRQIVDYWIQRLLGTALDSQTYEQLLQTFSQDRNPDSSPPRNADLKGRVRQLVALLGTHPDFQWR